MFARWSSLLCLLIATKQQHARVTAYPSVVEVEEGQNRCLRFNIPEDDDSHMIALIIPSNDGDFPDEKFDAFQAWYVEQVFQMTKKNERQVILKSLPNEAPPDLAQLWSDYMQKAGNNNANLRVKITATPVSKPEVYHYQNSARFLLPVVVNYVKRTTHARARRRDKENDMVSEGFGVCFSNTGDGSAVQVIFDIVNVNEQVLDDESSDTAFDKDRHLTPLERSLDASIKSANVVLKEMKYMEARERRMRETADNINSRVKWFSYLSVSVLLAVTYVQVTYLKRYFHKKKLM